MKINTNEEKLSLDGWNLFLYFTQFLVLMFWLELQKNCIVQKQLFSYFKLYFKYINKAYSEQL